MYWGLDSYLTAIISIIAVIIVLVAQARIKSTYNRYKSIKNTKNLSGSEVARIILDKHGLNNIYVVEVKGNLTDHYDPSRKVVRLSTDIFHGESIASIAVAAHECGHAIQDKEKYTPMKIRSFLVPFVNLINYFGYFSLIIGIFAGITGYLYAGIIVLCATLLFQLVTLPVEFDASKRAINELEKTQSVDKNERDRTSDMLKAAALTYVAGVLSTLLNILRLVLMARDR